MRRALLLVTMGSGAVSVASLLPACLSVCLPCLPACSPCLQALVVLKAIDGKDSTDSESDGSEARKVWTAEDILVHWYWQHISARSTSIVAATRKITEAKHLRRVELRNCAGLASHALFTQLIQALPPASLPLQSPPSCWKPLRTETTMRRSS